MIKGVIFDLEETLRRAVKNPAEQERAAARAATLAGYPDAASFTGAVMGRYDAYLSWARSENREAGDFELWHGWLLPEVDEKHLRLVCRDLTAQFRRIEGERRVVPGGLRAVRRLYERGLRLGIVSNLIGEAEVPLWLEESGVKQYFDAVILSSVCHIRRPDPAVYRLACGELGLEPGECASVSGGSGRDMEGEKAAGIGLSILLAGEDPGGRSGADCVVSSFSEILELPALRQSGREAWKE